MDSILLAQETTLRLSFFFGVLAVMALWEALAPRRKQAIPRRLRWPHNLALTFLNSLLLRLLFPITAVALALFTQEAGWGLFNLIPLPLPFPIAVTVSVIALDLIIYGQHRLFHYVPFLWRLHRMHHADLEIDVTTGARFHPIEIILSMLLKMAAIILLGIPGEAVLLFEIILNGCAMFNHSNIRLPQSIDALLRQVIVTPDMHRVHHSVLPEETHSNFGFNLSLWDRWLGTYKAQPKHGHEGMTIGLPSFRRVADLRLDQLIIQPVRED